MSRRHPARGEGDRQRPHRGGLWDEGRPARRVALDAEPDEALEHARVPGVGRAEVASRRELIFRGSLPRVT